MRISDWSSDVCSSDLLAAITVASKQPIQAALRVLPSAMFGASAYGLVPTKTSIEAITRDDLAAAQRGWMPQTATLIIVGALSPAEGFALAKRLFASWTGKASAAETPRPAAPSGPRIIPVHIPRPAPK